MPRCSTTSGRRSRRYPTCGTDAPTRWSGSVRCYDGSAYAAEMSSEDEWAVPAAGWDDEPAVRAYAAAAYDSLVTVLARHRVGLEGARACDFGCGTGLLTERLVDAGAAVDAVDTSAAMLDVLRDKIVNRQLAGVAALSELPASRATYDLVVCSSVCAFVPDYAGTVTDLVSRLRPGGVFVQWDWELPADEPEGHGLTRAEVGATLTSAGLTEVTVATGFEAEVDGAVMRPLIGHGRSPDAR